MQRVAVTGPLRDNNFGSNPENIHGPCGPTTQKETLNKGMALNIQYCYSVVLFYMYGMYKVVIEIAILTGPQQVNRCGPQPGLVRGSIYVALTAV